MSNSASTYGGIPQSVRRILQRTVLELRSALEEDFRKQLTALGFRDNGVQPVPTGRTISPADQRVRAAAIAIIEQEVRGDASYRDALDLFVRESAYTFLNRLVGMRCLEEQNLLLVEGQMEQAIRQDAARGASSLYWRVRNELPPSTNPREVWRETLRRAWAALSERVMVLFDPDSELAALMPMLPTMQRVVDALNGPGIPPESYSQDELLGWVYQYYNAQEKDEVYARLGKGAKLEKPSEVAAATCLYTERYMVDYLLQNTLGAVWAKMHPDSALPAAWPYFVSSQLSAVGGQPGGDSSLLPLEEGQSEGAGGRPKRVRDITLMDPACGGGHFLVRAFDMLVQMYREEGIEPEAEIPHLILDRNLHGIDIDGRAVQIAALALYSKGCALAGPEFRPRRLNLIAADALLPGTEPPTEYMVRFRGDPEVMELVKGIWQGLRNVRVYGSLLHPERAVDGVVKRRKERDRGRLWQHDDAHWELWKRDLLKGIREQFEAESRSEDLGQRLFGREAAKGAGLVEALGRCYDVVVANPPYQGSGSLDAVYKAFLGKEYADGKRDLYAAFILRCMDFCHRHGRLGMVTQQSWMFLRSFAGLRKRVLEGMALETIAHLGPRAFEEISGEVVNIALITLAAAPPAAEHRLTGFRLIGPKSASEKARLLREAIAGRAPSVASTPRQSEFLQIAETPISYWLSPRFFALLRGRTVRDVAAVVQGLSTADNDRFVRCFWEVHESPQWKPFVKGGGYCKWMGLDWLLVDWADNGRELKAAPGSAIRNERYYFVSGVTYSMAAGGSVGGRLLREGTIFEAKAPALFPRRDAVSEGELAALISSRCVNYVVRALNPSLDTSQGYIQLAPVPSEIPSHLSRVAGLCTAVKTAIGIGVPSERLFTTVATERMVGLSLGGVAIESLHRTMSNQSLLLEAEGQSEQEVATSLGLAPCDIANILSETGTPAGWHPLMAGYDGTPDLPAVVTTPEDLDKYLAEYQRVHISLEDLSRLKSRLRALYLAGPGAKTDELGDEGESGEDTEMLGARIPIPAESFLEELSQKLEVHPISVYRLLKEMREQEGLVCPPELKRQMEDYASVSLLRLLGYRWPEQDRHEREHGPIIDPDLVDDDGIIPLVPCGSHRTAEELIRMRLERDFGEEGAEQSLKEFRQWVGRDLGDWLRREFFKRHVQQFKQRPIAWHLVSPNRTFEAFVLCHKLSRETLQRLRAQYAGGVIERLRADQERARTRVAGDEVTQLQLQIEDVEEFRGRIERIERGDELKYRIRCRWKGEEATGRPGPYAPDIDDGVKVNIRPFQEAGVLAIKQVIKKW